MTSNIARLAFYLLAVFCITSRAVKAEEKETLFGSWGGVKETLEEQGISTSAVIMSDNMSLVSGGLNRGTYSNFLYQLATEIDTEKAGFWKNGTFLFDVIGISGDTLWQKVGDLQVSSNIDGMGADTITLYEAWYEHSFFEGNVTFLLGLHEYNSEFYALDYSSALLNSSFGFGMEVAQRGNSTYPITALAARVRYQPSETSYVMVAAYDGTPGKSDTVKGTHVKLSHRDGIFYAAEMGLTSSEAETPDAYYKVALGGWHHTTDYTDFAENNRNHTSTV